MIFLGCGHRADRLIDKINEIAAKHSARRAVHPLNACGPDGDDPDQNGVQNGSGPFGLYGHNFFGSVTRVNIDIGSYETGRGIVGRHQAVADLDPQEPAITPTQWLLTHQQTLPVQSLGAWRLGHKKLPEVQVAELLRGIT